jgi:hypothetical protein
MRMLCLSQQLLVQHVHAPRRIACQELCATCAEESTEHVRILRSLKRFCVSALGAIHPKFQPRARCWCNVAGRKLAKHTPGDARSHFGKELTDKSVSEDAEETTEGAWCSWLSHLINTQVVPSSILGVLI